jgi:AraC-like DNA-binding protein
MLRGLTAVEVSRQLGVTERTIQRDFQEIKTSLFQVIQTEQLRSVKLALAELDEIWREAWVLYHRPPREIPVKHGKETLMRKEDDRSIKLTALDRLTHIAAEKNRLVFPGMQATLGTQPAIAQNSEDAVAAFINTLPATLRNAIVEYGQQRIRVLEKSP